MSETGNMGATGGSSPSLVRGFLFADLRDYTRLVETHGASRSAELLERYRMLVREAVSHFGGAEIKTEGDSFYVVFDSVSAAVQCALAIQEAATEASVIVPDPPIRVGIGIHAGETVAVADGYVGSAVNVAARLCALAGAGEVLVSDTVKTLTAAVLPVTFESRGRQRLKGVDELVALFAVAPAPDAEDAWAAGIRAAKARRTRRSRTIIGLVGVALAGVVVVGLAIALRPPPTLPPGPWKIAVLTTMTGPWAARYGQPIVDAVQLAVDAAAADGKPGVEVELVTLDHGVPEGWDDDKAESDAVSAVADPRIVAAIGGVFSPPTGWQVAPTNEGGLLQCSPGASDPGLTRPGWGYDLGLTHPDRTNFVRPYPTNASEGPAMASFVWNDLHLDKVLVVDDGRPDGGGNLDGFGSAMGRAFVDAFQQLGGTIVRYTINEGDEPADALVSFAAGSDMPDAVYAATVRLAAAADLRNAMVDAGLESVPLLGFEYTIYPNELDETYLGLAGEAAAGSYATRPIVGTLKASFVESYRNATGDEPDGISGAAAACTEIILQSLGRVGGGGPSAEGLREAVRAEAADGDDPFETILGPIHFDDNGDSSQQIIQIDKVDPEAAGGSGAWVPVKQQDYGEAP